MVWEIKNLSVSVNFKVRFDILGFTVALSDFSIIGDFSYSKGKLKWILYIFHFFFILMTAFYLLFIHVRNCKTLFIKVIFMTTKRYKKHSATCRKLKGIQFSCKKDVKVIYLAWLSCATTKNHFHIFIKSH